MKISSLHFSDITDLKSVCRTIASNIIGYNSGNRYTKNRESIKLSRQSLDNVNDAQLAPAEKTTYKLVHWPIARIITLKPSEHSQSLKFQTDVD